MLDEVEDEDEEDSEDGLGEELFGSDEVEDYDESLEEHEDF